LTIYFTIENRLLAYSRLPNCTVASDEHYQLDFALTIYGVDRKRQEVSSGYLRRG